MAYHLYNSMNHNKLAFVAMVLVLSLSVFTPSVFAGKPTPPVCSQGQLNQGYTDVNGICTPPPEPVCSQSQLAQGWTVVGEECIPPLPEPVCNQGQLNQGYTEVDGQCIPPQEDNNPAPCGPFDDNEVPPCNNDDNNNSPCQPEDDNETPPCNNPPSPCQPEDDNETPPCNNPPSPCNPEDDNDTPPCNNPPSPCQPEDDNDTPPCNNPPSPCQPEDDNDTPPCNNPPSPCGPFDDNEVPPCNDVDEPLVCEPPQVLNEDETECINPPDEPIVCEEGFVLEGDVCVQAPLPPKKNGHACSGDCTHPKVVKNGLVINGEKFNVIPYLTEQPIDTEMLSLNLVSYTTEGKDTSHVALTLGTGTINIDKTPNGTVTVTEDDPDNVLFFVKGTLTTADTTGVNQGTSTATFFFGYNGDSATLKIVSWDFTHNDLQHTFLLN